MIIGGGIAGTVTAMALQQGRARGRGLRGLRTRRRRRGRVPHARAQRHRGAGRLGLDRPVAGLGFDTPRLRMISGTASAGRFPQRRPTRSAAPSQTIRRADLYRALRQTRRMRRGITYRLRQAAGRRAAHAGGGVQACSPTAARRPATFSSAPTGCTPRTRESSIPPLRAPRLSGPAQHGRLRHAGCRRARRARHMHMIFGQALLLRLRCATPTAASGGSPTRRASADARRARLAAVEWRAELMRAVHGRRGPISADHRRDRGHLRRLEHLRFSAVPRLARRADDDHRRRRHAASPSSGQGASMAIEDAVVLAKCLRDHPDRRGVRGLRARPARAGRADRGLGQTQRHRQGARPVRPGGPRRRIAHDFPARARGRSHGVDLRAPGHLGRAPPGAHSDDGRCLTAEFGST